MRHSMSVLGAGFLCACGGGSKEAPPVPQVERPVERTGSFYDSAIIGLEYSSASGQGITDANGLMDVTPGEMVTFSIGGVTLGTAPGSAIMTPLDFFADSDLDSNQVINEIRFLLALDDDTDPQNGIEITEAVRAAAADWSVDFDMAPASFDAEVSDEIAEANTVQSIPGGLWDAESARSHFEQTFLCAFSGVFSGTSVSTVTGTDGLDEEAVFTVVFREGGTGIQGFYSDTLGSDFGAITGDAIAVNSTRSFVVGDVDNGGTFEGAFMSGNWLEGTWDNPDDAEGGTFSAARVGHQDDAKWRITGTTSEGDDFGMDIDADGNVTGALRLTGTPALASATLEGTFAQDTGQLTGTVTTPDGDVEFQGTMTTGGIPALDGTYPDGTFSGTGCRLR